MSFFLSKSLEGRITEEDLSGSDDNLIYEDVKEDICPLSIKINGTSFEIKNLKKDRFVINLNYEGYKDYSNLINKNENVHFYIFDDLLFTKKVEEILVDSYEKLSGNLIKLDIIII